MWGRAVQGYTLIELMVTVAVLAVLVAIAYPSFQGVFDSNRVASSSNELVASLALARSEAIRTAKGAGVCASTAGGACDGKSWGDGWLVWSDGDGDGNLGSRETVLRYRLGNDRLVGGKSNLSVAFDARGRRRASSDQQITLQPAACNKRALLRTLTISAVGQVRVVRGACQ